MTLREMEREEGVGKGIRKNWWDDECKEVKKDLRREKVEGKRRYLGRKREIIRNYVIVRGKKRMRMRHGRKKGC